MNLLKTLRIFCHHTAHAGPASWRKPFLPHIHPSPPLTPLLSSFPFWSPSTVNHIIIIIHVHFFPPSPSHYNSLDHLVINAICHTLWVNTIFRTASSFKVHVLRDCKHTWKWPLYRTVHCSLYLSLCQHTNTDTNVSNISMRARAHIHVHQWMLA
jgi:hypothetical protein